MAGTRRDDPLPDRTIQTPRLAVALLLAGCPATAEYSTPCNYSAECPPGQVCKDGLCQTPGSVQPLTDSGTVQEAGAQDLMAADAAGDQGTRLDAAFADRAGADTSGGLDRAAQDRAVPVDARAQDRAAAADRPPPAAAPGALRAAAGWSSGQRFRLRSRLVAMRGRASGQRFTLEHRVEVLP